MSPAEAARLLDLPADATPEQLETRFLELRRKLEEKIAKAPTPGLQAKYRETLVTITTAFEALTLAADTSTLPLLSREGPTATSARPQPSPATTAPKPTPSKTNREFAVVALIAVLLLGGGGWWIMKVRADNEEKARVAEVARVEAERKAAEEKAAAERKLAEEKAAAEKEKARQESLFAKLRADQAEFKIRWEGLEKELSSAERKLSELKSDVRNLEKEQPSPQSAELKAQYAAQGDYVDWLQPYLSSHAAKTQLAKLDAFLSAKALDEAVTAAAQLDLNLGAAVLAVTENKKSRLVITADTTIISDPVGLRYIYTDAYGRNAQGTTPFRGELPLGSLTLRIQRGVGWTDYNQKHQLKHSEPLVVKAVFTPGVEVEVTSEPNGLTYHLTNAYGLKLTGLTPIKLTDIPSGSATLKISKSNWPDVVKEVELNIGKVNSLSAAFIPGIIHISSTPTGANVYYNKKKVGQTVFEILDAIPRDYEFEIKALGYKTKKVDLQAVSGKKTELSVPLEPLKLAIPDNFPLGWIEETKTVIESKDGKFTKSELKTTYLTQFDKGKCVKITATYEPPMLTSYNSKTIEKLEYIPDEEGNWVLTSQSVNGIPKEYLAGYRYLASIVLFYGKMVNGLNINEFKNTYHLKESEFKLTDKPPKAPSTEGAKITYLKDDFSASLTLVEEANSFSYAKIIERKKYDQNYRIVTSGNALLGYGDSIMTSSGSINCEILINTNSGLIEQFKSTTNASANFNFNYVSLLDGMSSNNNSSNTTTLTGSIKAIQ